MSKLLFALLIVCPFLSFSQHYKEQDKNHVTKILSLDLGLTGIQVGGEMVVGKNKTLLVRAGLSPVLYNRKMYVGEDFQLVPGINTSLEYRVYYNFAKRIDAGKEIQNNGGNYFAFHVSVLRYPLNRYSEISNPKSAIIFGPLLGMNRPIGKTVVFNFNIGPAIINEIERRVTGFSIWGDARFLIKLN